MTTQNDKNTSKENLGKIAFGGMGGFLNPPTHPEHDYSVSSVYGDNFSMSLSAASESEWLNASTVIRAKAMLDEWQKPDINSQSVKEWIYQVLGYFENCFSPDGIDRNVSNSLTWIPKNGKKWGDKWQNFKRDTNKHLGVMLIRKYYPEYKPSITDFKMAYWGKKP